MSTNLTLLSTFHTSGTILYGLSHLIFTTTLWGRHYHLHFTNVEIQIQKTSIALAGVAQWIECWLANQRVTDLIPNQGTCLGYSHVPRRGSPWGNPTLMFLSLSFSPLPLSLKTNKISVEGMNKERATFFKVTWSNPGRIGIWTYIGLIPLPVCFLQWEADDNGIYQVFTRHHAFLWSLYASSQSSHITPWGWCDLCMGKPKYSNAQ